MVGKMMSSGTRKEWEPSEFPNDRFAADRLREWLRESISGSLDAIGLNFGGADLSGGNFSESWFTGASLVGVNLTETEFYRADLEGADLSGANLTAASLVRANLDEAILRDSVLDRVDFGKASLYDVDASRASLRDARLMGASLLNVNLCGADLTNAVVEENSFKVKVDKETLLDGFSGTVFGPVELITDEGVTELRGDHLANWIRERNGNVQVISPRRGAR
ncbi:pentapeptide repeat-containing protein [Streptomyces gelaticus]|uniref:pentapeptide repeat-containing protein n=1 Tax=Streptomyces gelaticus TaxID=285446 RepID=UPI0037A1FEBF